jgi:hypothetical protein
MATAFSVKSSALRNTKDKNMAINFAKFFRSLLGSKPKPTPAPAPTPVTYGTLRVQVYIGDVEKDDKLVNAPVFVAGVTTRDGITGATGDVEFAALPYGSYTVTVTMPGFDTVSKDVTLPSDAVNINTKRTARTGIVHAAGSAFVDDLGEFYPLGATLMWALRGWKFERDRVRQNLAFLQKYRVDFVRILAEVGWAGNDIQPDQWDDYDALLANFIDETYDVYGMRTQITMIGGGTNTDYSRLVDRIIAIVKTRQHKVFLIEVANESFQNFTDSSKMKSFARRFVSALPDTLVACSSTPDDDDGSVLKDFASAATASVKHFERSLNESGWKGVRKPWEMRGPIGSLPSSQNEPQGPRSSVCEYTEPIHMVMNRWTGIIMGWKAYVLHNGAGVGGQVDTTHNRPANLWEVPGIDTIMDAVRNLDSFVPKGIVGTPTRTGVVGHPSSADAIWVDGADHGVVRDYACITDFGFVQTLIGIKQYVDLKFNANYHITALHPVTGAVVNEADVTPGANGAHRLQASLAASSDGTGGLIIVATHR